MRRGVALGLTVYSAALVFPSQRAMAQVNDDNRNAAARAFTLGEALASDKRFNEAAPLFANAYLILATRGSLRAPDAQNAGSYLYAWAQAERLRGNCACALALYDEFLRFANQHFPASESWPAQARSGAAACPAVPPQRALCADQRAAPTTISTVPAAPTNAAVVTRPLAPSLANASPQHRWYTDRVGLASSALAVTALATSAWAWSSANAAEHALSAPAISYQAYQDQLALAKQRERVAWLALGTGVVFAGFASYRFMVGAHHATQTRRLTFTPSASAQRIGIVVGGTF